MPEYGAFYAKLCSSIGKRFRPSERVLDKRRKRYQKSLREYEKAKEEMVRSALLIGDTIKIDKRRRNVARAKKEMERAKNAYLQPSRKEAIDYLSLGVDVEDVEGFGNFVLLLSYLLVFPIIIIIAYESLDLAYYAAPVLIALPIFLYSLAIQYPEILAKRVRVRSAGMAPEVINYMVMAMKTNPSLNKAMAFAAENSKSHLADGLKRVLWEVQMNKWKSIEDAFVSHAFEAGKWNEDYKRALYSVRVAAVEANEEGRNRALENAQSIIINGTKMRVEKYAASLTGPTTVLFAMGVVLPLIIGASIPMLVIKSGAFAYTGGSAGTSHTLTFAKLFILMDVIFPLFLFAYAYRILGNRPTTCSKTWDVESRGRVGLSAALASLPLILAYYTGDLFILALLALSIFLGVYAYTSAQKAMAERKKIMQIEDEFPDFLFQVGSRLVEGAPLERAIEDAMATMGDSAIAIWAREVVGVCKLSMKSLKDVIIEHPVCKKSRIIGATMKLLLEIVEKNVESAGKVALSISSYLREIKGLEHDVRVKLKSTVDMMKATCMIFAPFIMGVTLALNSLMYSTFSSLSPHGGLIPPGALSVILAIYLFLIVIILTYFTTGIEEGDDPIMFRRNLGIALPLSMFLFFVIKVLFTAYLSV